MLLKKWLMCLSIFSVLFINILLASAYVVQVGQKKYTVDDLKVVMEKNQFSMPDLAIEKLQQEVVLSSMGNSRQTVFQEIFGFKYDFNNTDSHRLMMDSLENNCLFIFMKWLNERARSVPVVFLNTNKFWEMVTETEAYKVRKEYGRSMSARDIFYTPAELRVHGGKILASAKSEPYVLGKEFNSYVLENYNDFLFLLKRDKSLVQVRNLLLNEMVNEKVISDQYQLKAKEFSNTEIEQIVDSIVRKNTFCEYKIVLPKRAYNDLNEMLEELYTQYRISRSAELNQLRMALKGKGNFHILSYSFLNCLRKEKIIVIRKNITQGISQLELQTWINEENIGDNFHDSRMLLVEKKYKKQILRNIREKGIKLHLLDK